MATVLIIGNGGREHALAVAINESYYVRRLWVSEGNAGLTSLPKSRVHTTNLNDEMELLEFCSDVGITMVVVGPEKYLADGIVDFLENNKIPVFGPRKNAAIIETNKKWAKDFMSRHNIPTARYTSCTKYEDAMKFIEESDWEGFVVKASGLYGGKGVFVTDSKAAARMAIVNLSVGPDDLRRAAKTVIIEEKLKGYEISVQAVVDGNGNFVLLPPSQDHKCRFEGGRGPNTGGMGAICPFPLISKEELENISENIIKKTVNGLIQEERQFKGVLYAGLMISADQTNVLEFNCRFGDPETQSILPLLESDMYLLMKACCDDKVSDYTIKVENKYVSAVSIVIKSYPNVPPDAYGNHISGVEEAKKDAIVYVGGASISKDMDTNLKTEDYYYTKGGRVLTVCGKADTLEGALFVANAAAHKIHFDTEDNEQKADFRGDIGFVTKTKQLMLNSSLTYAQSGVSVKTGNDLVDEIKNLMKSSGIKNHGIGGFGAVFDLKAKNYSDPLLVSGTDGVGTKLKIAQEMNQHKTIGQDLVAMCVNDIITCGAEPLFFLDYFSCGKLNIQNGVAIIKGIMDGCSLAQCPLVGGETAEMPGMYKMGEYDLAGFSVGAVERDNVLPKINSMKEGNLVVGIRSSGLHSNGFSLVRKLIQEQELDIHSLAPFDVRRKLGDILLTPTIIYRDLLTLIRSDMVLGVAHITGGGLVGNIGRILPDKLMAVINKPWIPHDIFLWLIGNGISFSEMMETFNMGIGLVLIINSFNQDEAAALQKMSLLMGEDTFEDLNPRVLGKLHRVDNNKKVMFDGIEDYILNFAGTLLTKSIEVFPPYLSDKKKVAVFISGSGTNLQALIDHTMNGFSKAKIVLVISNIPNVKGLERATKAGIPTKVVSHKNFDSRQAFEEDIDSHLVEANVEFVCLAGFMRILTNWLVSKWSGKMLNIHPSILPSFKGCNAQKQALNAGVFVTGCSVHFVNPEVDCGKIVAQETVPIFPEDDVDTLTERIKQAEHKAYPRALEDLVRGKIGTN